MQRRFYHGWYIALALAVTQTVGYGIAYYTFSVFITPMEAELDWTRTQLSGALSVAMLVSAALAYPIGAWIDRNGARLLMTLGSVGAALLMVAWSQVTSLWAFYLIWIGMGVCYAAMLYEVAFTVVAQWFARYRGRAMVIITFSAGFASTVFQPLAAVLLAQFGWRTSVVLLACVLAILNIPLHAFVLRRAPEALGLLPDGEPLPPSGEITYKRQGATLEQALHSRAYWLLILAFCLALMSAAAIRVHFIPFLIDLGVGATFAATAAGSIGLMQVAGRVAFAPLDERLSSKTLLSGVFGLQAFAFVMLLFGPALIWIWLFIGLFGAAVGAKTLARASVVAEVYGAANYGRISGLMSVFGTLAATAGPVAAGWIYDNTGSYNRVLWLVVGLMVIATGIIVLMKPYKTFSTLTPEPSMD
jgi:MFS family permease